jgi:diadenosine tetraphosphate (Ap4A) HIT family hydrolase
VEIVQWFVQQNLFRYSKRDLTDKYLKYVLNKNISLKGYCESIAIILSSRLKIRLKLRYLSILRNSESSQICQNNVSFFVEKIKNQPSLSVGLLQYLLLMPSPISFLNALNALKTTADNLSPSFIEEILQHIFDNRERDVLHFLVYYYAHVTKSAEIHFYERSDLLSIGKDIERAIMTLVNMNKFDNHKELIQLLLPKHDVKDLFELRKEKLRDIFQKHYKTNDNALDKIFDATMQLLFFQCLEADDGVLPFALFNDVKQIFGKPQIASLSSQILFESRKAEWWLFQQGTACLDASENKSECIINLNIPPQWNYISILFFPRTCPACMIGAQALSRLLYL